MDVNSSLVPLCGKDSSPCLSYAMELANVLVQTTIASINIVHIIVLIRLLHKSKKTAFKIVALASAFTDIVTSMSLVTMTNCSLRTQYVHTPLQAVLIYELGYVGVLLRSMMTVLQCVERFIAMKFPFHYESTLLARKPWTVVAICIALMLGFIGFNVVVFGDKLYNGLCLDTVFGYMPSSDMVIFVYFGLNVLVNHIVLFFIVQELWKINEHSRMAAGSTSNRPRETNTAAKYTIYTTIVFYTAAVPQLISIMIEDGTREDDYCHIASVIAISLYGVLNTLIYGILSQNYRSTLRDLLCCVRSSTTKIHPFASSDN